MVPHPPLLVPAIAAGAASEVAGLLAACESAVAELVAEAPETIVCVGSGSRTTRHRTGARGTLAGYGVHVEAPSHHHGGLPHLPLSLTIGRWLLERVGWRGPLMLQEIATTAPPEDCATVGRRLGAESGRRSAWLVLGDGTACRSDRAPGHFDPRAKWFDERVSRALAQGDVAALADLDATEAEELQVAGRAPWQVLAGALAGQTVSAARLRYDDAPFGVGYLVAHWSLHP